MARCEVVQIQCDRCKRTELLPPTPKQAEPVFLLTFRLDGKKIKYDDLCQRCIEAVKRIILDLDEWERELNQTFGPTVETNKAPPLQVAPNYTPPQPHSAAAGKR
jgi:hypothetical protein